MLKLVRPALALLLLGASAHAQQYDQLKYRYIGPEGNRVTSVAGVGGDVMTYYAGAASGGLWKTTDGGVHWAPMFDKEVVSSIGSVTVAPSDPNVVWVGTGEPFIRSHVSIGWGMYKSTDAGRSWTRSGLDNTGRISRIVVHPTNPDIVYVAALGTAYGPQPDRGIFRTTDGGKSWEKVLFVNDSTGAADIIMDPNNPRILYAGMWQVEVHTWGRTSGGAGSGIWKSLDGGTTWKRLTAHGLPEKPIGKIGLGMSRANSDRIYALIETGDGIPSVVSPDPATGRLFRSDDAGATWKVMSSDLQLAGRTAYYNRFGVTPDNADEAYFLSANWAKTLDGGKTIIDPPIQEIAGGDHHDIWFDPTNGNRAIVSHDGGISITQNRGRSWLRRELPIAQMYHATTDTRIPYTVCGNRQDGPSACGPSNTRTRAQLFGDAGQGVISRGAWVSVGGGESGWATPDPTDNDLIWSSASGYGSEGGVVSRYDVKTGIATYSDVWPLSTIGWSADSLKYRFVWTFPLTISPHDHNRVYVGSQYVMATSDGGRSWQEISPDLTRNDKSRQVRSGGLTPDNIGVEYAGVVFAIAESRLEKGLIWAGTNDGLVQLTRDDGRTWTNVTKNIPGMPEWGTVSNIEPSRYAAGTAYLTVDAHQVNNRDPWIYRTTDYGRTFTLIVNGIPKSPLSYAHVVREDPVRRGLLYAGTENGLYASWDDGASWQPLQGNLPHAPVYWITVQEHFSDLVVATYGRGFWILDDITPLRTVRDVAAKDVHLFAPRFAYRYKTAEARWMPIEDMTAGDDPPYGAALHFWLKADAKDSVTFTFTDAAGYNWRTMKVSGKAGLNRAWWDLESDRTRVSKVRTTPLYAQSSGIGFDAKPASWLERLSMIVPPGTYTMKMNANGQDFTEKLEVRKDPNYPATDADIAQNIARTRLVLADVDSAVATINTVQGVRIQLVALRELLKDDPKAADLRAAADSLEKKFIAQEEFLRQLRYTGRGQDDVRWPMRISEQLVFLGGTLRGADQAPTTQQVTVANLLHAQLGEVKGRIDVLLDKDLAAFNERLRQRKLASVIF
ncbi:MAG: repeat-containing glycosyl hydrolase [Gemmatimonadetes bacterium]|nr:repeat-containing glycosyl hydrolase [Gemmatimonadota bacterium]